MIDHQIGTIKLAISTPRDEIIRNTRALARTAVETGMPLVLSSSQEDQFQGLLLEDLRGIAPTAYEERIKRPGVIDAWLYEPFRKAVEKTGRKKIIMAGLTNDMCVLFIQQSARFRMDTKSKSWSTRADHRPRWLTMQHCVGLNLWASLLHPQIKC